MYSDLNELAKNIIESNQYCTIGSVSPNGKAWVSPVAYSFDKEYNFYFVSLPTSQHAKNISRNESVTFAIYDSQQVFGEGVGLQIEGVAKKVSLKNLPFVISTYSTRPWPYLNDKLQTYLKGMQKILNNRTYTAYQIIPTKIWMNDPNSRTDVRVEVELA